MERTSSKPAQTLGKFIQEVAMRNLESVAMQLILRLRDAKIEER